MTDRKRDPLPEGYQFGDAAAFVTREPMAPFFGQVWNDGGVMRVWSGADWFSGLEYQRRVVEYLAIWNVIEGEHDDAR